MLDGVLIRGTTPTQTFPVPKGLTKSGFLDFIITYRQKNKTILIKRKVDWHDIKDLDSERNISVVR
jgi:hypothetical protein